MRKKFSPMGDDLFGEKIQQVFTGALKKKFMFAPFSVLNSREGQWQERKRALLDLGIESEVGRGGNLLKYSDTLLQPDPEKRKLAKAFGTASLIQEGFKEERGSLMPGRNGRQAEAVLEDGTPSWSGGTSIFDPVLCELSYDWFCPPGGQIVDPFCGGSVRGVVGACMGYHYWGGDLRQEQIDANIAQGQKICPGNMPKWVCGDSNETVESAPLADFVFSCPPYADLERYSDNPKDLSTMTYEEFIKVYRSIIFKACARLKPNRFAAFVVGDIRCKKTGNYKHFHGDTIKAFVDAGLGFYNDCILINAVGTLALRVTRQFEAGRKLGKSHQNLLVFIKGDPFEATELIKGNVPQPMRRPTMAPPPMPLPRRPIPPPLPRRQS